MPLDASETNRLNFFVDNSFESSVREGKRMDILELKETISEQNKHIVQRLVYRKSKCFWEKAKCILKQGNYSPFVYFDYLTSEYVFLEGTHSEELLFEDTKEKLRYKGYDVVISPMLYQKLFNENAEDSFVFYKTASALEEHLIKNIIKTF